MRRSAFACVGPAWNRMVETCFRPFRFGIWARLALIAILTGEVGGGGGNWGTNMRGSDGRGPSIHLDPRIGNFLATAAPILIVLGLLFVLVLVYLNARARFVLMDSVIERTCRLGDMWGRWRENAKPYFAFNLGLALIGLSVALLVGIQFVAKLRAAGLFTGARVHIFELLSQIAGLVMLAVFVSLVLTVVQIFARDFLVPVLGLERPTLEGAWQRLRGIMAAEPGEFIVYLVAKVVLNILAFVLRIFILVFCAVLLAIPLAICIGIAVVVMKGSALVGIVGGVLVALVALPAFLFVLGFLHVPFAVFFEAFALEFFADRFPPLAAVLYPAPPIPAAPMNTLPEPAI